MVRVARTLAAEKSSSVTVTQRPSGSLKPLTTDSQGTSSPVVSLTRRFLTAEKSRPSSKWKLTSRCATALKSPTGIVTSPKEIVPFQIACAMAGSFFGGSRSAS